jgi:FMN phosphatase YigB (HAD superfamily)
MVLLQFFGCGVIERTAVWKTASTVLQGPIYQIFCSTANRPRSAASQDAQDLNENPGYGGAIICNWDSEGILKTVIRELDRFVQLKGTMKIKLVLFDVGGVLIDLQTEQARRSLESQYQMTKESYAMLTRCTYETEPFSITELATIGKAGSTEYIEAFRAACGRFVSMTAMRQNRESIIGHERSEMLELLSNLKRSVRVAAFTNTIAIHWEMLQDRNRFSFPHLTEQTIASHLAGFAKPTKQAYEQLSRILKVNPSDVLFIDDSKINVAAAIATGMRGLVFTQHRNLVEDLQRESLLPVGTK